MPRTARKSDGEERHEANSLVGQPVQVPGWVFPRDPLPKGAKFWPGKVIGVAKADPHRIYVKLDGTDEEFYFPIDEVQKWLSSAVSPAPTHSAVHRSTRSQISTRSGRQATAATAVTPGTARKRRARRSEPEEEGPVRSQSAEADPVPAKAAAAVDPEQPEAGSAETEPEQPQAAVATSSDPEPVEEPITPPPSPKRRAVAGPEGRPGWGQTLARVGAEAALGVASSLAVYAVAMAIQQGS